MPRGIYDRSKKKDQEKEEVIENAKGNGISEREEEIKEEKVVEPAQVSLSEDEKVARMERLRQKPIVHEPILTGEKRKLPSYDHSHQQLFEAPDGTIMVGDLAQNKMWYAREKMWINPLRDRITPEERAQKALAKVRLEESRNAE